MVKKAKALLIALGVILILFAFLLISVMSKHSDELNAYLRSYAAVDHYRNIKIADRSGTTIYDGGFSDDSSTRLSTFHIIGDQNGSRPSSILAKEQDKPLEISRLTGYRPSQTELQLTIDLPLQIGAYTLLQNHDYNGAIVVMDYTTGEILAMVSTPSVDVLDPEDFEAGAFLCKATTAYAPGSTMKAVTAAAVLEKNTAAAEAFTYDCTGADSYASCYQATAHGVQHLDTILSHSCNCGTGAIVRTMLLPDELNRYVQNAHLLDADIICDFDCQSGNIDANDDLTWSAIGQSADLVTPVGMCAFYSAIANDGIMVSPHLFSDTEMEEKRIMCTDTARYISDALIPVAASTDVACTAFGKTGSAEVEGADAHSWFVCSLMDENAPTYTITVFLENGGGAYYAKLLLAEFTNLYILGGG